MNTKKRTSFAYSIISVSLVLLLLGLIGLVYIQTNSLLDYFRENVAVLVEIKPSTSEQQKKTLRKSIEISPFTKSGSVQFTSKERGAHLLSKEFGKDISAFGFENPLFDIIQFKLNAGFEHPDSLAQTKSVLLGNSLVHDVYIQAGIMSNIDEHLKKGTWLAIALAILFLIIAISLIYNTIRLALYSNRMLIKNMQLVGATKSYIKKPYLWKSLVNGSIAAMIAISFLLAILLLVHFELPEVATLENSEALIGLFTLLLVLGIGINLLSTEMVIRKYLNMRIEEAY